MKALVYGLLTILMVLVLSAVVAAQSPVYKLDAQGKVITKTETAKTGVTKTPDKVYQVVDGVTFYQGSKGGVYYFKTSKKTGKPYKVYVSKKVN